MRTRRPHHCCFCPARRSCSAEKSQQHNLGENLFTALHSAAIPSPPFLSARRKSVHCDKTPLRSQVGASRVRLRQPRVEARRDGPAPDCAEARLHLLRHLPGSALTMLSRTQHFHDSMPGRAGGRVGGGGRDGQTGGKDLLRVCKYQKRWTCGVAGKPPPPNCSQMRSARTGSAASAALRPHCEHPFKFLPRVTSAPRPAAGVAGGELAREECGQGERVSVTAFLLLPRAPTDPVTESASSPKRQTDQGGRALGPRNCNRRPQRTSVAGNGGRPPFAFLGPQLTLGLIARTATGPSPATDRWQRRRPRRPAPFGFRPWFLGLTRRPR